VVTSNFIFSSLFFARSALIVDMISVMAMAMEPTNMESTINDATTMKKWKYTDDKSFCETLLQGCV
jgi:hypothetical protein